MILPNFNYHQPSTLIEAYKILDTHNNSALIAGGTDLLVEIQSGIRNPQNIISLNKIKELKSISEDNKNVYIGPTANFHEVMSSDIIGRNFPALIDCISQIGSHQVRNLGTIGGNLCTCASCADTAPLLLVYNAQVEVSSSDGIQLMNLSNFLLDHHKASISNREILTKIIVPKQKENFYSSFLKFGLRESSSISVASLAVGLLIEEFVIKDARLVVGACAPTAILCQTASKQLLNINMDELKHDSSLLNKIVNSVSNDINPISDIRASAEYRKDLVKTLAKRAIIKALNLAKQ